MKNKKPKIFSSKKLWLLPVFSSVAAASLITAAFSAHTTTLKAASLSSSQTKTKNDTSTTEKRIFSNYNPKYIFALYTNDSKSLKFSLKETSDQYYTASISFGLNIEYINTVFYYTMMEYGWKNPNNTNEYLVDPLPYVDSDGTQVTAKEALKNKLKVGYRDQFRTGKDDSTKTEGEGNSYSSVRNFFNSFNGEVELQAKADILEYISQAILDGKLFVGPYTAMTAKNNSYSFNHKLYLDNDVDNYIVVNDSSNTAFWPLENNLNYILKTKYAYATDPTVWKKPETWKTLIEELDTLPWVAIKENCGIGQYLDSSVSSNNVDCSKIASELSTLLFKNLIQTSGSSQSLKFTSDIEDYSHTDVEVDKTQTSVNLQSLLGLHGADNNFYKQAVYTIRINKDNDEAMTDFCNQTFHFIPNQDSLHYFSPWWNDFFVYNYSSTLTDEHQIKAWNKWKGTSTVKYCLPYQLIDQNSVIAPYRFTEDGCVVPAQESQEWTLVPTLSFEPSDSTPTEKTNPNKPIITDDEDPEGNPAIGVWDGTTCLFLLKPEFTSATIDYTDPTTSETKTQTIEWSSANFLDYLRTRTPEEFKNFVDTGYIDTTIVDSSNPANSTPLFGEVQAYWDSGTTKASTAAPLFIRLKKSTETTSAAMSALYSDIKNNQKEYQCIIDSDSSLHFEFNMPSFKASGEVSSTRSINSTSKFTNLATKFYYKKTNNNIQTPLTEIMNELGDLSLFKEDRIRSSDVSYNNRAIFQTSLTADQLKSSDPDVIDSSYCPENLKSYCKLWPKNPDKCGLVLDGDKLTCTYNNFPRVINQSGSNNNCFFFVLNEIQTNQTATFVKQDYTVKTVNDSLTLSWSSSDTSVAAISAATGYLLATGAGTTTITVTGTDSSGNQYVGTKEVTVSASSDNLPLNKGTPSNDTVLLISGPSDITVGSRYQYSAMKQNFIRNVGDTYSVTYTFGSSFYNEDTSSYSASIYFDFTADEPRLNNKDILSISDVYKYFEISANNQKLSPGTLINLPPKSNPELTINLTLKQEFLNINYLNFKLTDIWVDDSLIETTSSSLMIDKVVVPVTRDNDVWTFSQSRQESGDEEHCFKSKGDSVTSTFKTSKENTEYLLNVDEISFSIEEDNSSPYDLKQVVTPVNTDSWIIKLYNLNPEDPAAELMYSVVFTRTLDESSTEALWVTTIQITQETEQKIYGKLIMDATASKLSSVLSTSWYTGEPEVPTPTPDPKPDDPEDDPTTKTINGVAIGIMSASTVALVLAIIAQRKNKQKLAKIQKDELDKNKK